MDIVLYVILTLISVVLLGQWWIMWTSYRLKGKAAPEAVARRPQGVLYYFYHAKCGPCRSMGPIIDALAERHPGRVEKVDIMAQPEVAQQFGVKATPTTLLVKDGDIAKVMLGIKSATKLEELLGQD